MNQQYQQRRAEDALLESRTQSFELAFRMQMEADEAFDLTKEPAHIHAMYGEGLQARQMMIARRLLERGVRFVQVWHGAGQPWDSHDDIKTNHGRLARECDQPIAALLTDLKQRGMLEDTLVIWGGEFGRTPTVELPDLGANTSVITVSGRSGTISRLKVGMTLTHSYVPDVSVWLTGPDGTRVQLVEHVDWEDMVGFIGTIFDDSAAEPIRDAHPPLTGPFRPEQPLSLIVDDADSARWVDGDDALADAVQCRFTLLE